MNPSQFFDSIAIQPEDYENLTVEEAYRTGLEMGCFVQSVSIAQTMEGSCAIRIPSDRAERAKQFLEDSDIEHRFSWINDDVMLVRLTE